MKMMDNSLLSFSDDNNTPKSFMSASPTTHVETFSTWTIAHIVPPPHFSPSVPILWYFVAILNSPKLDSKHFKVSKSQQLLTSKYNSQDICQQTKHHFYQETVQT